MFSARNPEVRDMLAGCHVSVIGCGSIGSALADMLVRAGLGNLTLIDPEIFAVENVGRHVLTLRDVGRTKVDGLADRLRDINPGLNVETRAERFSDAGGLLICCADSRRCESMVNAVSLRRGIPAVFVGVYGAVRAGEVQFCVPGRTPCRECFASFREPEVAQSPAAERYTDPEFDETRVPGQRGLWGSVLAVSGVAFQGILALLGVHGRLDLGSPVWIVNLDYSVFRPYAVTFCKVRRGCAVCDDARADELTIDARSRSTPTIGRNEREQRYDTHQTPN